MLHLTLHHTISFSSGAFHVSLLWFIFTLSVKTDLLFHLWEFLERRITHL